MRQRILAMIREFPGLHMREIARQLETSVALVGYHVDALQDHGVIRGEKEQRYMRFYPETDGRLELDRDNRRHLALLRQPLPLEACLHLLEAKGPLRHGQLVEAMQVGKSKLSFHLAKLIDAGVVVKTEDGWFDLMDRQAITELLLAHRPTSDIRDRFNDLWTAFYSD